MREQENRTVIPVIIRVSKPGYIPDQVELRAQISPEIFTANIFEDLIESLRNDPDIVDISRPVKIFPMASQ